MYNVSFQNDPHESSMIGFISIYENRCLPAPLSPATSDNGAGKQHRYIHR